MILFETGGAPANRTVELKSTQTYIGQPRPPPPPGPPATCPAGYTAHAAGLWSNPSPCGYPSKPGCKEDAVNVTLALCARKCNLTEGCLAFEVYQGAAAARRCFTFIDELKLPFIPVASCSNCVRNKHSAPPRRQLLASDGGPTLPGFKLGHGTFLLNGEPIRLFAGALQHFRIHPDHWGHRLALAKAMGLNAVQTLIPWMMMEPTPGEFKTGGFTDIVKFAQMAQKEGPSKPFFPTSSSDSSQFPSTCSSLPLVFGCSNVAC